MPSFDLLIALGKTLKKTEVQKLAQVVAADPLLVRRLFDLTFHKQPEVAFRAAWILEHVAEGHSEQFAPLKADFLKAFPGQDHQSCRRHYLNILLHLRNKGALPPELEIDPLIEVAFQWLIDEKVPVAVQVQCISLLLAFVDREPWIAEELSAQTEFLMKNGSAGMVSRGRKVLKSLAKKA